MGVGGPDLNCHVPKHKTFTKLCNREKKLREFSKMEIICSKFGDRTGIKLDIDPKSKMLRNAQMVEIKKNFCS